MELNDHLREMLKELGQAINESISGSGRVHDSIQRIRDEGYNLYMVLDAKVGVNKRDGRGSRGRSSGARGERAVSHQREGPAIPEIRRHRSHAEGSEPADTERPGRAPDAPPTRPQRRLIPSASPPAARRPVSPK
jgi:hypothetical protein